MYPSATYPATKARRLTRIRRRACRELVQAYEHGKISLRQFDLASRLSRRQQKRVIAEGRRQVLAQQIAASIINRVLSEYAGKEIDLSQICAAIICSIR